MNEIQTQVTGIGSKVADLGRKGWTFFNKKVSAYSDPNDSMPSSQSYANFGSSSYQNADMPRSNTSASLNGRGNSSSSQPNQYDSSANSKDWDNW